MRNPAVLPDEVQRRIYFYQVLAADGQKLPYPFDPVPALNHIMTLPFDVKAKHNRYYDDAFGGTLCCWQDQTRQFPSLVLANIRRKDFPHMELNGQLTSLAIPVAGGLAEPIHVVFFRNDVAGMTFAGLEYNFYGPRANRVSEYFGEKAEGKVPLISLSALVDQDTSQRLRRLQNFRLFRMRINQSAIELVKDIDQGLGSAFGEMLNIASSDHEAEIMVKGKGRRSLPNAITDMVKRLIVPELYDSNSPTKALNFEIGGTNRETNHLDIVDLLSEKLISKKQIKLANTRDRILDNGATFDAIEDAYDELKDQLVNAASVELT